MFWEIEEFKDFAESAGVELPTALNDPFDYRPSPLILRGQQLLLEHLRSVVGDVEGKMLGVMLVREECADGRVGFLFGFSGAIADRTFVEGFVPPIYDMHGDQFRAEEQEIAAVSRAIDSLENGSADSFEIDRLKRCRSQLSQALQRKIFESYVVVNGLGERRTMADIFERRYRRLPPSGAGECAAPKMLHFALTNGLKPLQMGEFWVGGSVHGELRIDGQFYGACLGKCKPILEFVLRGVDVADVAPELRRDSFKRCDIDSIYADIEPLAESADYVVYDKPAGMLSVRGLDADVVSLEELAQLRCATSSVVHRLDQATSGVIIFAKSAAVQVALQRQFEGREVTKKYVALVEDWIKSVGDRGAIDLPISTDFENRPRQRVDVDGSMGGKRCKTTFRVLSHETMLDGRRVTRLELKPHTGRTHQLRVHCAFQGGDSTKKDFSNIIGSPIVGDPLYGLNDDSHYASRMFLHAQSLTITDISTSKRVTFATNPQW